MKKTGHPISRMNRIGHVVFRPNRQLKKRQENRDYHYVALSLQEGVVDFLFTDHQLAVARKRAERNPEDCGYGPK